MPEHISISNNDRHDAERWTGLVLRIGVWVSAGLMTAGLILASIYPSTIIAFSGNPSLNNLLTRLLSGTFDPVTLMFAGLVFLMFTPIFRVIAAVAGFALENDWRFVIISSVVLLLLSGEIIYSVFIKG